MKQKNALFFSTLLFSIILCVNTSAQDPGIQAAEKAPLSGNKTRIQTSKAMWDYQFGFSAKDATNGDLGMAGIVYFNNEFIVSRWNCDTMYRFDRNGVLLSEFRHPEIYGTRSISTDGTWLYFANATSTIYRVDPSTLTVDGTITSSAPHTTRFASYDPTLDSGNGGFWTGDFNTEITAINLSGTVLRSIPIATHGINGKYGVAFDNYSFDYPALWVFNQGDVGGAFVNCIDLSADTVNAYSYDLQNDGVSYFNTYGIMAGGVFFSSDFETGKGTLMCFAQVSNSLMCYTTADSVDDVSMTRAEMTEGLTQIPLQMLNTVHFDFTYKNKGTNPIDKASMEAVVYHEGTDVAGFNYYTNDLQVNAEDSYNASYTPNMGNGLYRVEATVLPNAEITDMLPENNSLAFEFEVGDSILARDNGIKNGGYAISTEGNGLVCSMYSLETEQTINGICISLYSSTLADTTWAVIYATDGSLPTTEIAKGNMVITATDVMDYYLTFSEPVVLSPGTYAFGYYQSSVQGFALATSDSVYKEGVNFKYSDGAWSEVAYEKSLFIRPVVQPINTAADLLESANDQIRVYPVPAKETIHIAIEKESFTEGSVELFDLNGRLVASSALVPGNKTTDFPVDFCKPGIYMLSVKSGGICMKQKIVIM